MRREHHLIESSAMGQQMNCWLYGHWGPPFLVMPSAAGLAHEWDQFGMIGALSEMIEAGRLKLYNTESNVSQTLNGIHSSFGDRLAGMRDFETYIVHELVPAIRADCRSPEMRISVTGVSLGAFYACQLALKFPEVFEFALCFSGRYELTQFFGGQSSTDLYFMNPLGFLPGLAGAELERVRQNTHLSVVCGQGPYEDGCIEESRALARLLSEKQISHEIDFWGHDSAHEWGWWQRQAAIHFARRLGN